MKEGEDTAQEKGGTLGTPRCCASCREVLAKQRASIVPVGRQDPELGGSRRSDFCSQDSAKLPNCLSEPSQVVSWQHSQLLKRFATLNIASGLSVLIRIQWSLRLVNPTLGLRLPVSPFV